MLSLYLLRNNEVIEINNYQRYIVRLARLEKEIDGISFYKAKKKARNIRKGIKDMLVKRYGFKRN